MFGLAINTLSYNLGMSLYVMFQGMLGIFIFMAIFYLLIYGLDRLFREKDNL